MSTALGVSLIILIFVVIAAIIATTIYFVKLLIELSLLAHSLNETTSVVKEEIEPILSELSVTLKHVNSLAQDANTQMSNIKKITATIIGAVSIFAGKFKFLSGSFMKGFMSAFNLFRRK